MSWMLLAPGFLVGVLAIALPIILHFLRQQPTRVNEFPNLVFLIKSIKRKARFQSLNRWLILLARCAIFALLALAFARPFLAQHFSIASKSLMIVLDNSYSMGASGQFSKAKASSLEAIKNLGPDDQCGLIVSNIQSHIAVPLGENKIAVEKAIDAVKLSFGSNNHDGALRMADAQLSGAPSIIRSIEVYSDNQALAWSGVDFKRPLSRGTQLFVASSPDRQINDVAIEQVKILTPFISANQKVNTQITIHNLSSTPQKRTLILEVVGNTITLPEMTLTPGQRFIQVLDFTAGALQPTRGCAHFSNPDDLPANDSRYFALNPVIPLRVGLWPPLPTEEVDLLSAALAPSQELATVNAFPVNTIDDINKSDLLVLRPTNNTDPSLSQYLISVIRNGKAALLFVDQSHAAELWLKELGFYSVTRHSGDDPLHLGSINFSCPEVSLFSKPGSGDLFEIRFNSPPDIQLPDGATTVASFEDGTPAIVEAKAGKGSLIVVATGLDRESTLWPLQSTFLPFVQESLKHLSPRPHPPDEVFVGDPIPGDNPQLNSDVPGVVEVSSGSAKQLIAVNVDPAESDLTSWTGKLDIDRLTGDQSAQAAPEKLAETSFEEAEQIQRWWWYGLFVATVLLLIETFLANRTSL